MREHKGIANNKNSAQLKLNCQLSKYIYSRPLIEKKILFCLTLPMLNICSLYGGYIKSSQYELLII